MLATPLHQTPMTESKKQGAYSIISNKGQPHLSPAKTAAKTLVSQPSGYKCVPLSKPDLYSTTAANEMAAVEAARAEERERMKRQKLEMFRESLKMNLNETIAKKKEEKTKVKEQKAKEEEKKAKRMSAFSGIKLKKKPELQNVATSTEVVVRTVNAKMVEAVTDLNKEKYLTVKERYSPPHLRVPKKPKKSPEKVQPQIKGKYLDEEELRELGFEKAFIDEAAYEILEQYCVLQKLRRGDQILTITPSN